MSSIRTTPANPTARNTSSTSNALGTARLAASDRTHPSFLARLLSVPLLLSAAAVVLWLVSLPRINPRAMNDLGLISVLPLPFLLALGLLTVAFVLSLTNLRAAPRWASLELAITLTVTVLMLYGTTAFIYAEPRFSVTWLHAGFTEYIQRTGSLLTLYDARFSWPGFFTLAAFFNKTAGLGSLLDYANWAPLVFAALYSLPLWLILRAFSRDERVAWLGMWFFYLTNWIGQDYISPQGLNLFFYMFVVAILLTYFKQHMAATRWPQWAARPRLAAVIRWGIDTIRTPDTLNSPSSTAQRTGLLAIVMAVFLASASSHQLTPIALTITTLVLVIWNRITPRSLPLLFGIVTMIWIAYFTTDYLGGHGGALLDSIGQVNNSVGANVTERIRGSADHQLILNLRLLMTMAIWLLAGLGGLRRWVGERRLELTFGLLIVCPFGLIALNSYGGEGLMRVYLLALPFTVALAAVLFYPNERIGTRRPPNFALGAVIGLVSVVLIGGYLFTRYGNERMDYYTSDEIAGLEYIYNTAKPGDAIVLISSNMAARYQKIDSIIYDPFPDERPLETAAVIDARMRETPNSVHYLYISRAQRAYGELYIGFPTGWVDPIVQDLVNNYGYELVFENRDAQVYKINFDKTDVNAQNPQP